jgi:hypothetical protein
MTSEVSVAEFEMSLYFASHLNNTTCHSQSGNHYRFAFAFYTTTRTYNNQNDDVTTMTTITAMALPNGIPQEKGSGDVVTK